MILYHKQTFHISSNKKKALLLSTTHLKKLFIIKWSHLQLPNPTSNGTNNFGTWSWSHYICCGFWFMLTN